MRSLLLILLLIYCSIGVSGQTFSARPGEEPENAYPIEIIKGDTVVVMTLPTVYIFKPEVFKNRRDRIRYDRMVRDVKRVLPYAHLIRGTLLETYEFLEMLPTDEAREQHLKKMEKDLFKQYMPELKKLTLSQGRLMIKLIDRYCNQTSFELVKAYLGGFRAGFWNIFAGIFGASLKSNYDPNGEDARLERIILMVERGLL